MKRKLGAGSDLLLGFALAWRGGLDRGEEGQLGLDGNIAGTIHQLVLLTGVEMMRGEGGREKEEKRRNQSHTKRRSKDVQ